PPCSRATWPRSVARSAASRTEPTEPACSAATPFPTTAWRPAPKPRSASTARARPSPSAARHAPDEAGDHAAVRLELGADALRRAQVVVAGEDAGPQPFGSSPQ